ncbi:MAG: class I SAM-dependent methyltransferase [Rhodobacteraceae bacterium]|nr:class I SAM-dependent methyltransferase [Paracoccaceae bacterium]
MTAVATNTCLTCGGRLGPVFYEADAVPVHSCLLLDTTDKALAFPRGDVRLAPCHDCGTITNVEFDGKWSAYSPEYEDQQSFSPTFNSFAGRLAQDLTARHDLGGETVIDIGCSKGDFLALMCEAGASRGIGIDPSVVDGRVGKPSQGTLELISGYYAEDHTTLPAKLISNRHTLEHVHDVHGMLTRMHRHAVKAGDAVTFIEVPSMTRVLEDCAFEDIYYEHCSYFTPGALARALRKAGFGVTRLWFDYDDQYLLAEASTDPAQDVSFDIEEPVSAVLDMVADFEARAAALTASWRTFLAGAEARGERVAIWGSGSKCIAFWHATDHPAAVSSIVDINPNRWGKHPPGLPLPISEPESLRFEKPDVVIAMNAIYKDEISADLAAMGVETKVVTLGSTLPELGNVPLAELAGVPEGMGSR